MIFKRCLISFDFLNKKLKDWCTILKLKEIYILHKIESSTAIEVPNTKFVI